MITVVIVDDQPLVREGLRMLIDATDDMSVAGEAGNGHAGISQIRASEPDVALIDIQMPVMDGLEAITELRRHRSLDGTRILVLTTFGLDEYVFRALQDGADGYLLKDTPPDRILDAIRVTAAGGSTLSGDVLHRLVASSTPWSESAARQAPSLTARERDVLDLLGTGCSNPEIAAALGIGDATVKTYVSRLLAKFGVRSRVALAVAARGPGAARPQSPAGGGRHLGRAP
jgi:DNA-binding NarL/FixJ family response regulator